MSYKVEYATAFQALKKEPEFASCFVELGVFSDHVGSNSMHLRRMAVVKQKAHYKNPEYMQRLQKINDEKGWNIQFDAHGRISPTPSTMKVILQVLLDHRLYSELSHTTYDVPPASPIG